MAHVTAAALVSENKTYAHPASVDSLPTSAGQEDHVSMAPWAGRKLLEICANTDARARHRTAAGGACGRQHAAAHDHARTAARARRDPRTGCLPRARPSSRPRHRDPGAVRAVGAAVHLPRGPRLIGAMEAVAVVLACFGGARPAGGAQPLARGRRWASVGHVVLAALRSSRAAVMQPVAANLATYQARHPAGPSPRSSASAPLRAAIGSRSRACRAGTCRCSRSLATNGGSTPVRSTGAGLAADLGLASALPSGPPEHPASRRPTGPESTFPSSYALSEERGDDVWAQARTGTVWSRYAVADHAYGPWLPLAHGARYEYRWTRRACRRVLPTKPRPRPCGRARLAGPVPARPGLG